MSVMTMVGMPTICRYGDGGGGEPVVMYTSFLWRSFSSVATCVCVSVPPDANDIKSNLYAY